MYFLVFFVIPMALGFWAQHRVKSTFARNLQVPVARDDRGGGRPPHPRRERPGRGPGRGDTRARSPTTTTPAAAPCTCRPRCTAASRSRRPRSARTRWGTRSSTRSPTPSSSSGARCSRRCSFASQIWMLFLFGGLHPRHPRSRLRRHRALRGRGALPARHASGRVRRLEPREAAADRPRLRRLDRRPPG